MQSIEVYRDNLEKKLHEKNAFTDLLANAEEKTGVQRLYIVSGLTVFLALYLYYLVVGYGAFFLASLIGFVYPAYCSVIAIESEDKSDDTKWLTYWVVYAVFSLMENFTDVFFWWIPWYAFLKCLFLVYCMAPTSWNGSVTIYHRIIRPFVLRHQKNVESYLDLAKDVAADAMREASDMTGKAMGQADTHHSTKSD